MINMWTADYLSYKGNTSYIAAYRGAELVWERPVEDTINYFYIQNAETETNGNIYLVNYATTESSFTTGYSTTLKRDKNIDERPTLEYSFDKRTWRNWEIVDDIEGTYANYCTRYTPIELEPQQKVYFRGNNNGNIAKAVNSVLYFSTFDSDGIKFAAGGDIWSILANDQWENTKKTVGKFGLAGLFWDNLNVIDVSNLTLESINYASYGSFVKMFLYAKNITSTPILSKNTHLADYCYQYMFYSCDNLETIQLDSFNTESKQYCYDSMFYWCNKITKVPAVPATILSQYCYRNMYAHTSISEIPELPATSLNAGCYEQMFIRCEKLTKIPSLKASNIPARAYKGMFSQCYNIEEVGDILASKLNGTGSCANMFDSTRKLKSIPKFPNITNSSVSGTNQAFGALFYSSSLEECNLPEAFPNLKSLANTTSIFYDLCAYTGAELKSITLFDNSVPLGTSCYHSMFRENKKLTTAPELPATTLAKQCYYNMFYNCTALTTATELPATTLAESCYEDMFQGCTALTTAPTLPATTLVKSCYNGMFNNCQSLSTAPELPATTLAENCYVDMFRNCSSITTAPELPATTLAPWCYYQMFFNCTGLNTAPELPATTLANYCYYSMFYYCTSLTKAPVLIAEDVPLSGYKQMFNYCKNLNEITCYAKTFGTDATQNWVSNVASTGTFYKDFETEWATGTSGIPSGWTVVNINEPEVPEDPDDITLPYVTFRAEEAGSTLGLAKMASHVFDSGYDNVEYSTDKTTWKSLSTSKIITLSNVGDEVYVRISERYNLSDTNYTRFKMTGKIAAYGNVMALLDYTDLNKSVREYGFFAMFQGCTALTKAPKLPATTLADSCYRYMFSGCSSLTQAPELPATTLAFYCYHFMFADCTSLVNAPELPAIDLAEGCYHNMFRGCTLLNSNIILPAEHASDYCYTSMFRDCKSLKNVKIFARVLYDDCFVSMFEGCTAIEEITCLAEYYTYASALGMQQKEILYSGSDCFQWWLSSTNSTGTFYRAPGIEWPTGGTGIPSGWTILDYTA